VTRIPDPIGTALLVIRQLDAQGVLSTVGGSIAASFAGEPRSTVDVDIVAALDDTHIDHSSRLLPTRSTSMPRRFDVQCGCSRART
jgi:hypothetical protein